jgi:hypothetical protein
MTDPGAASLGETRAKLLAQHAEIRVQIDRVREICKTLPFAWPKFVDPVSRLIETLGAHNLAEEEALQHVLPELDAFGDVRKSVMISDHISEHEDLHAILSACITSESSVTVANVLALMERLLAHMEHEENLFLNAKLFR